MLRELAGARAWETGEEDTTCTLLLSQTLSCYNSCRFGGRVAILTVRPAFPSFPHIRAYSITSANPRSILKDPNARSETTAFPCLHPCLCELTDSKVALLAVGGHFQRRSSINNKELMKI